MHNTPHQRFCGDEICGTWAASGKLKTKPTSGKVFSCASFYRLNMINLPLILGYFVVKTLNNQRQLYVGKDKHAKFERVVLIKLA